MGGIGFTVLEGEWIRGRHLSVRGLFDLIAELSAADRRDGYHYETMHSKVAARDAILRAGARRGHPILCLATHGHERGLSFVDGELSRKELCNDLVRIHETDGSSLAGLHMGACLFGAEDVARFTLERSALSWVAGYDEKVDFLESSALDLLFLGTLAKLDPQVGTHLSRAEVAAARCRETVPGLVDGLGFHVWARRRGGGIKDLCAAKSKSDDE